jgi:hypothetical protein
MKKLLRWEATPRIVIRRVIAATIRRTQWAIIISKEGDNLLVALWTASRVRAYEPHARTAPCEPYVSSALQKKWSLDRRTRDDDSMDDDSRGSQYSDFVRAQCKDERRVALRRHEKATKYDSLYDARKACVESHSQNDTNPATLKATIMENFRNRTVGSLSTFRPSYVSLAMEQPNESNRRHGHGSWHQTSDLEAATFPRLTLDDIFDFTFVVAILLFTFLVFITFDLTREYSWVSLEAGVISPLTLSF